MCKGLDDLFGDAGGVIENAEDALQVVTPFICTLCKNADGNNRFLFCAAWVTIMTIAS